jgi:hypothetical protein
MSRPVNHPLSDVDVCPACGDGSVSLPGYPGDCFDCDTCGHSWPPTRGQVAAMRSDDDRAVVFTPGKPDKPVRNLRWLLTHRREVTRIVIADPAPGSRNDATMRATLRDGREYFTGWASLNLLREWTAKRFDPDDVFDFARASSE